MTEQEKRNQRVQVRLDLEDAEESLRFLQVKAARYADLIDAVTRKLRSNAELTPSGRDFDLDSELSRRLTPEQFGLLKASGDEAIRLIAELRQQRQAVYRLREQDGRLRGGSAN